ncbi:hypothetical protein Tco_0684504 [Tanacetum coccineum]
MDNRGRDRVVSSVDHSAWKQVEMPSFYSKQNPGSKKAKTSETTSGSVQGGLNLNEETDGSGKEVAPLWDVGGDVGRGELGRIVGRLTVAKMSHVGCAREKAEMVGKM